MKRCVLVLMLLPTAGCAALPTPALPAPSPPDAAAYRIGCPDVLDVSFADRPDRDCVAAVDVDGCVPLGDAGRVPVQGLTTADAGAAIAAHVNSRVAVAVAVPRSGRVFVTGPDNKRVRVMAYTGPTPVLDFLQTAGAVQPMESKLNDVYVVRPNVCADGPPKIYHVDVEAVVFDGDPTTNVLVQAADHVYVGETRRASFARLLPPWARPAYRRVMGLMPRWD